MGLHLTTCWNFSFAQDDYPAIKIDSALLKYKMEYLKKLESGSGNEKFPNIILIVADDLGKNDINLYDPDGVPTPNINKLANSGVTCTEAYTTSPICFPSRASLVTGRYQQRFGCERMIMQRYPKNKFEHFVFKNFINTRPMYLIDPWYSPPAEEIKKQGLPESEVTIFEIMQRSGYQTACIGKWHLGYNSPFLPNERGVNEFYGFLEAFSLYAPVKSDEIINYHHKSFQNRHIWRQKRDGPCAIRQNNEVVEENEYLTTSIAEHACDFMERNQHNPFFLYVPFNAPHTPFQVPISYYEKFSDIADKNKRVYFAMIAALDDAVGSILSKIDELGMEENTLVFFASDNGGATYTGATDNGDLKGGKITNFEGGLNIPFVMKWKGKIPAGEVYNQPVSMMDIFATSCNSAGISLPENIPTDGVNLIPYLNGQAPDMPHEFLFWRTDYNKVVRHGKWKLILNTRDGFEMLYDLENDKHEQNNLVNDHPEMAKFLKIKLQEWEKELIPPSWPGVMEYEEEIEGIKMRFAL
jgi:arylsulfatase A-like enzyme